MSATVQSNCVRAIGRSGQILTLWRGKRLTFTITTEVLLAVDAISYVLIVYPCFCSFQNHIQKKPKLPKKSILHKWFFQDYDPMIYLVGKIFFWVPLVVSLESLLSLRTNDPYVISAWQVLTNTNNLTMHIPMLLISKTKNLLELYFVSQCFVFSWDYYSFLKVDAATNIILF